MLLHEIVDHAARRAPSAPALVTAERSVTFGDLAARVEAVAGAIATMTTPAARVAVLSENTIAYVELLYGVPRAGRILTMLNHRLHPQEWAATIAGAQAEVLVGERALLDRFAEHHAHALPPTVVCTDDPARGHVTYEELVGRCTRAGAGPTPTMPAEPDERDVAWLIFTSGTTGRPKGVMLTHRSLVAAATGTALARGVGHDDVYLFPFPLCHVAGYNVLLFHLFARPVVLLRRFDAADVLRHVARAGVTTMSLAPTMVDMLLDDPAFDRADRSTLRSVSYGASAMPPTVLRRAVERLGVDLQQGYGMTELSGNAVFLDGDGHRAAAAGDERLLGAAGWPHPLCSLRIVDADGVDVEPGAIGEIVVRGDQVAAGYWDDPAATAETFRDGWLHTGDLGRVDPADGLVSVVDRKKDVIVSGGENVASREVEDVLARHPAVREVAVVGAPDDRWGQVVCAVVVRRAGRDVSAEELVALSRAHLAGYKAPRRIVFAAELPKTASGKVEKSRLRDALR